MTRLQGHRTNNRDLEEHQTSPKLNFNLPVLDRFFEPLHRDGARFAVQQKRLGRFEKKIRDVISRVWGRD